MPALIGCSQSADIAPSDTAPSEGQIAQTTQPLNTGLPVASEDQDPSKGHVQVTKAAINALSNRGLLPPQMNTREKQYYIYYGNYFADNTWAGRPGTLSNQKATGVQQGRVYNIGTLNLSKNAINGEIVSSSGSGYYSWNDSHDLIPVKMQLFANGKIRWFDPWTDDKPNAYMEFNLNLDLISHNFLTGFSQTPVNKVYSLDNLYHYTFRDVYEMPGLSQQERDQNATLKLYPLVMSDLGNPSDKDIAQKGINYLVNQPIVANADRGITKYGAILYQLARKFFSSSCYEPSLSELIPAGNDRPGMSVGTAQGTGVLSSFTLQFPHTMLGGMPYMCANGSDPKDLCSDGLPTWPIWVPEGEPDSYPISYNPPYQAWLEALNVSKPGHSDRAALIYLGWATHIIQDAATPHHAANWTGYEHDRQDGYGDDPNYWRMAYYGHCPDGRSVEIPPPTTSTTPAKCADGSIPTNVVPTSMVEAYSMAAVNDLLGPEASPKTQDQICNSAKITTSQLLNGELNYKSVQPVFLSTAQDAFRMKKASTTSLSAADLQAYVAGYLSNAVVSTIKLLVCAPPVATQVCAANNELFNQGTIAGTQQRFPWDFNVFTIGDTSGLNDVGGPVAAGGALTLSSFAVNRLGLKPVALVAGGKLTLRTGGTVYGKTYDGGGKDISTSVTLNGSVIDSNPITFATVQANLVKVSQALGAYAANGTTVTTPNLKFTGSSPSYNVFSVSGAALANYRSIEIAIPSGATAIINVVNDVPDGTAVTIQNAGFNINGTDPRRILWNFQGVKKISTASINFPGSVLAPQAAVDVKYGAFDGTLIAQSLVSTYTEFHWQPFRGDFPPVTP
jgi:choice-of-anchor A domain-containing protein